MRLRFNLLLVLTVFVFMPGCVFGEALVHRPAITISGRLVDVDSAPLENLPFRIALSDSGSFPSRSINTREDFPAVAGETVGRSAPVFELETSECGEFFVTFEPHSSLHPSIRCYFNPLESRDIERRVMISLSHSPRQFHEVRMKKKNVETILYHPDGESPIIVEIVG